MSEIEWHANDLSMCTCLGCTPERWVREPHVTRTSTQLTLCAHCARQDEAQSICQGCYDRLLASLYRSGFEEHLPMPFWFRIKFALKYYLLRQRVKPLY